MPLSTDPTLNTIQQRAMTAAAAFHDELAAELLRRLQPKFDTASLADLQHEAIGAISDYADQLADLMADANLVAWFNGAGEVAQLLPPSALTLTAKEPAASPSRPSPGELVSPGRYEWSGMNVWLPLITQAVEDLESRQLVTRQQFDRLGDAARRGAMPVARLRTRKALDTVQHALAQAVEKGTDFREFQETVTDALGRSPLGPGQMENLFRTSVTSSYSQGFDHIADTPTVHEAFPYEEVLPIRDARLTKLCETIARSGINKTAIFRRDDPVYQRFKSPRHFQDRCGRRLLSVRDAAARGIEEAQRWLETGVAPTVKAWVSEPRLDPESEKTFADFQGRMPIPVEFSIQFREEDHPRSHGKFSKKNGAAAAAATPTKAEGTGFLKQIIAGTLHAEHALVERVKGNFAKWPAALREPIGAVLKTAFSFYAVGQDAARAVAREVGGEEHAERVGNLLMTLDVIASKAAPAVGGGVAGPAGAALAYWMPLASLAYLGISTARHPLATIRAARKGIKAVIEEEKTRATAGARRVKAAVGFSHDPAYSRAEIELLFKAISKHAESAEQFEALLYAALDQTRGDVAEAVKLAEKAIRRSMKGGK